MSIYEKVAPPAWPEKDPAPEVTTRDPRPVDAPEEPNAVRDLRAAGLACGWDVRVGYSRGPVRTKTIGTFKRVETMGVWANAAHGWRFSALYSRTIGTSSWTWRGIHIWRAEGEPFHFFHATVTDLKAFIEVRGSVGGEWFAAIDVRESGKKATAKARPAKRKVKAEVS